MPTYEKAPAEVGNVADKMIEKYHAPLRDAKVSIDFLMALAKPDEGEIAAQVGNHLLVLAAGQFDVIEWRDESAPVHKPRRKREAAVA